MSSLVQKNAKLTGFAIVALRATIKALELNVGQTKSKGEYRYEIIRSDSTGELASACIYRVEDAQEVEGCNRSLSDWARAGKEVRLALIGLTAEKFKLESGDGAPWNVFYKLNVISGEARLTCGGVAVNGMPSDIAGWAAIGLAVEKPLFESLKAAQECSSAQGVQEVRQKMIKLGIIRESQRTAAGNSQPV